MYPTLDVPTSQTMTNLVYPSLDELARRLPDVAETFRFLTKLRIGDVPAHRPELGPCLIWTRATTRDGYSTFKGGDLLPGGPRQVSGHLWLHLVLYGPVMAGNELDHICHDPDLCPGGPTCPHRPCVLHTMSKPIAENRMRANHPLAINAAKERCEGEFGPRAADGTIIGHLLTHPDGQDTENVYRAPDGSRKCRPCHLERAARWQRNAKKLRAAAREKALQDAGHLTLLTG